MNIIYLGLGSNLKNPERQLRLAIQALKALPKTTLLEVAPFYKNKAWGRKASPNYCNTVVKIVSRLTPFELLTHCRQIEKQQGRLRRRKLDARTLDIDIIFYADRVIKTPKLAIPHPRLKERDFVMIPLQQLTTSPSTSSLGTQVPKELPIAGNGYILKIDS